MSNAIALSQPYLRGQEWPYVKNCLDEEWVSSAGKYVDQFEQDICRYTQAKYAVAMSSGTAALHIALKVGGIKPDDEVIVPTVTFIAPINAVHYMKAKPIFMDCDEFYNIDVDKIVEFIETKTSFEKGFTFNKGTKRRIRALIVVHVFGNAVNLKPLVALCKNRNILLIEDATESLGTVYKTAPYRDKHAGTIGDIGCLSFNGNKIITTGGGGMLLTNTETYAKRARYLSTQAKDDPIFSIHEDVGYNYRLTNVQAAIGIAQLKNIRTILKKKRANYKIYKNSIKGIKGLNLADVPSYADNNHWMYALQIDKAQYGRGLKDVLALFLMNKIEVRPLWYLNHLQTPYRQYQSYKIEKASRLLETTLNIPCSAGLSKKDIAQVVGLLKRLKS